jgi:hypothetical protein
MSLRLCLLLFAAGARAEDGANEKADTNGECHYAHYDDGIDLSALHPECKMKCDMEGKAKNKYDCENGGADGQCCQWDESTNIDKCDQLTVQNELYKAADACCDEASEKCGDDGWPTVCNLGCASIMVPLANKCMSKFATIGMTSSVSTPRSAPRPTAIPPAHRLSRVPTGLLVKGCRVRRSRLLASL